MHMELLMTVCITNDRKQKTQHANNFSGEKVTCSSLSWALAASVTSCWTRAWAESTCATSSPSLLPTKVACSTGFKSPPAGWVSFCFVAVCTSCRDKRQNIFPQFWTANRNHLGKTFKLNYLCTNFVEIPATGLFRVSQHCLHACMQAYIHTEDAFYKGDRLFTLPKGFHSQDFPKTSLRDLSCRMVAAELLLLRPEYPSAARVLELPFSQQELAVLQLPHHV